MIAVDYISGLKEAWSITLFKEIETEDAEHLYFNRIVMMHYIIATD